MLEAGQTLLHYRIVEKLGEGGMGVVWRAVDTTLDREVAIKVLPEALAADAERLARFEREARLLAALNHPNVAAVHSVHDAQGLRFLAMELVAGEDLAERLARGPMPLDEALAVARQIAEGLEAAHEAGIVHRDLKPANVRVAADGRVKVLDFGLAKAMLGDPSSSSAGDPAASPTLTTAGTVAGMILGTAAYMSPEQARGRPVDRRADVWAFGCVLYEMLTGRRLFDGETISDVLAAVLRAKPDFGVLPPDVPRPVRRLLARCLDRDPRTRLRDVGEARVVLETLGGEEVAEAPPAAVGAPPSRARSRVVLAVVGVAALAAGALLGRVMLAPVPDAPVRRLSLAPPAGLDGPRTIPRIAPDGSAMAYLADGRLWVQELDGLTARPVTGGEDAQHVTWSPDGRSLAFTVRDKLWRTGPSGDPAMVADLPAAVTDLGGSISWTAGDTIVIATGNDNLFEVPVTGGTPRVVLEPDLAAEADFHQPHALPDGRGIVYVVHRSPQGTDTIEVLAGGKRKVVLRQEGASFQYPVYSPSGHVLYERQDTNAGLWALPFSLSRLEATGEPFLVAVSGSRASVSRDGTLLYSNAGSAGLHQLVWVGRDGKVVETIGESVTHADHPVVSPGGDRLGVCIEDGGGFGLWVYDLVRESRALVAPRASCGTRRGGATWSADGASIVFGNVAALEVWEARSDGSGGETTLTEGLEPHVGPDGHLVFVREATTTRADIWWLAPGPGATPQPLVATEAREDQPRLSPAGGLVAYVSTESGRTEVYVRTFPGGDGRWQVSTEGGDFPRWSATGDRLYYLRDDAEMVEVEVAVRPTVRFGRARALFGLTEESLGPVHGYDVVPDGQRFVTVQELRAAGTGGDLTLVTNWAEGLRERR